MGKRFVETELWKKEWFRKLPPRLKSFWFYLIMNCDCSGVWEPDFEQASFSIGEKVVKKDLESFGDRIEQIENGKWWLNTFISFQNGELSERCPAHKPIIKAVLKHKLAVLKQANV
jgi:hypothetical protein